MEIKIDAWVKNPCVAKRVEIKITSEEVKELARKKLEDEYGDEAIIELLEYEVHGGLNF